MLFEKVQLSPHWFYWKIWLENRYLIKTLNFACVAAFIFQTHHPVEVGTVEQEEHNSYSQVILSPFSFEFYLSFPCSIPSQDFLSISRCFTFYMYDEIFHLVISIN